MSLDLDTVQRVSIETTDQGPVVDDVFLCVTLTNGEVMRISAQSAEYDALYDTVSKLPGFNFSAVIESMSSTGNAVFNCWLKDKKTIFEYEE